MRFFRALLVLAIALPACSASQGRDLLPLQSPVANASALSQGVAVVARRMRVIGKVTAIFRGGYTIQTRDAGYLHVYTSKATILNGGKPKIGETIRVLGTGSPSTSIAAIEITNAGDDSTPMHHVLTADYLGDPWGTTAIAWTAAAPYLSWAETGMADATAIHNAGIHTMTYVDPNRTQLGGPLYNGDATTFAHDCSGNRVTDVYANTVTQYVMDPAAASMQHLFAAYVSKLQRQGHLDALFEDDAGALSGFAPYTPFSAMPCGYSDAAWITDEIALEDASPVPLIFNGLSGLDGHAPSLALGLLAGSQASGGTYEQCFTSNTQPKQDGWLWEAIENTELRTVAQGKIFECMGSNTSAAQASTDARLYAYASFLLTYSPTTSLYRSLFATSSGLHVMPEVELVALQPDTPAPASIAQLQRSGGTFARTYAACYLSGNPAGACAVVVNPDTAPHPFPLSGYTHTLVLGGSGVLDGGTVSTAGPAPAATLGAQEAAIVFQ